jgi:hypothetical protein
MNQQQQQQYNYRPWPGLGWLAGTVAIATFTGWIWKTMWQHEIDHAMSIPHYHDL